MKSSADAIVYKKCDKCGMRGMKLKPGIIRQGTTNYVLYKCVYCGHVVRREV